MKNRRTLVCLFFNDRKKGVECNHLHPRDVLGGGSYLSSSMHHLITISVDSFIPSPDGKQIYIETVVECFMYTGG